MNEHQGFERTVAEALESVGKLRPSEGAIARTIDRASHRRQRPEWLALLKEPPMRNRSSLAVGSPTIRVAVIMAATLLFGVIVAAAGVAGSRLMAADPSLIVVDASGGGDHLTIAGAVASAHDGDEIVVRPGTYRESVALTKAVSIRGDADDPGQVVVDVVEDAPVTSFNAFRPRYGFFVDGAVVTISDMTLTGNGEDDAAFIVRGGDATIERVVSTEGPAGDPPGAFLLMTGGATGRIAGNEIDGFIWIEGASTPEISRNVGTASIRTNGTGTDAIVSENDLTGISAEGGSASVIEGNLVTGAQVGDCAILSRGGGAHPMIRGNTVRDNVNGICLEGPATLDANTVTGNRIGISVRWPDVTLIGNTVCENELNLQVVSVEPPSIDASNTICAEASV